MKKNSLGFTLIEVVIGITILVVLATLTTNTINPLELIKRARDAQRVSDMKSLEKAINVVLEESTKSFEKVLCEGGGNTCD